MADDVFSPSERAFLQALERQGLRFMIVGMSAALLQGARGATEDIDLWIEKAGGGMPAMVGGNGLDERLDLVLRLDGLGSFEDEYAHSLVMAVGDLRLRVLGLARVMASKRATGRAKDRAQLAALEEALAALEDEDTSSAP